MRYTVKAARGASEVISLSLIADNETDAIRQAKEKGYDVISVKAARVIAWSVHRRERFPLLLFSQELMALLDAGLTLVEAVETLAEKEKNSASGKLLNGVLQHLYQGRTLSHALEQLPTAFPPLYVATVRASEKTGGLKEALARYVEYQTQVNTVKRKLGSAAIYPVLLLLVGGAVTLFLLLYVVPKFSHIYADVGGDLPLLTRMLMNWGALLSANPVLVLGGIAILLGAVAYGVTRPATRSWLVPKLWNAPVVGDRLRIYELARFYRTLGMLLRSGIPLVRALEMASGLLSPALRVAMQRASTAIREGQPVSQCMEREGLTTPVARRMLRVGERSGQLAPMTERIASFYEDEIARWVDWFTRLFEPILMAAIGIVIGLVVLLLYLPIFELAGSIQ
ncbi:MAG: type II secretion system F family protein [Pseudomonadota bacterium]|nr:MAG: type II secretion system F family protein [Pseudomonadota bacterium]